MSAAVFAVLSVAPPVPSEVGSPLRLEALGDPVAGRPWLLRATDPEARSAPLRFTLDSPDAVIESNTSQGGASMRALVREGASRVRLRLVDGGGRHALPTTAIGVATRPLTDPVVDRVLAVEGVLVPELREDVIVRAELGPVSLRPVTEQVEVEPAEATPDACGLARFSVRVAGLGAPVSLVTPARRDELRLPFVAGGLAVRDEGDAVVVRATSPGATAHVVVGDAEGPTRWSAVTLAPEGDEGAARVPLPAGTTWVVASRNPDLGEAVSPLVRPPGFSCGLTPLGQRLSRGRSVAPALPAPRVLWDGPSQSAALARRRVGQARWICGLGLLVSVALEVVLLLGAGLGANPRELKPFSRDRRSLAGVLVAGISTLLLMGAAMLLAVGLRAP